MPRDITINKLNRDIELEVKFIYTREWKIRKKVAVWLIKFAAYIMGCGIKFDVEE